MKAQVDLHRIINQILALEVSKGHLKWKVSDIARITGVSRPLIYYHLGKTKKVILETSLNLMTESFYGFNSPSIKPLGGDFLSFIEELVLAQKLLAKVPALTIFYLKCRATRSPLQEKFIEIEKRFQKKLSRQLPHLNETQLVALHSILHGIVAAPFASEKSVRESAKQILNLS